MMIPIQYSDPSDSKTSFHIVTHIQASEIKYFTDKRFGECFWSNDVKAPKEEQCQEYMMRLFSLASLPPESKFTSAFIKSPCFSCEHCWEYGSISLFLELERIRESTIVFNGDVKNLAFKIFGQNCSPKKYLRFHSLDIPAFHMLVHLQRYYWNYMAHAMFKKPFFPRMVGSYFEVRILRPITRKDISMIVIPMDLDKASVKRVEELANSD